MLDSWQLTIRVTGSIPPGADRTRIESEALAALKHLTDAGDPVTSAELQIVERISLYPTPTTKSPTL